MNLWSTMIRIALISSYFSAQRPHLQDPYTHVQGPSSIRPTYVDPEEPYEPAIAVHSPSSAGHYSIVPSERHSGRLSPRPSSRILRPEDPGRPQFSVRVPSSHRSHDRPPRRSSPEGPHVIRTGSPRPSHDDRDQPYAEGPQTHPSRRPSYDDPDRQRMGPSYTHPHEQRDSDEPRVVRVGPSHVPSSEDDPDRPRVVRVGSPAPVRPGPSHPPSAYEPTILHVPTGDTRSRLPSGGTVSSIIACIHTLMILFQVTAQEFPSHATTPHPGPFTIF